MLGYVPANPAMDGKLRRIDVKVAGRDVTLTYRQSYSARPESGPVDSTDVLVRERLLEVVASTLTVTDLKVQVKATQTSANGQRQAQLEVTIDPSGIALREANGNHQGTLALLAVAGNENEQLVGRVEQRMELNMSAARYEQAKATGIPYSLVLPLSGPARIVKVVVYDFSSDRIGSAAVNVK
jgi:hypothetical protein